MMEYLIAGGLLLIATSCVAYPILSANSTAVCETREVVGQVSVSGLLAEKERLYRAIKDLDFDFHAGKVSESDYQEMSTLLRHQALSVLSSIEQLQARPSDEDEVERAILARRQRRKQLGGADADSPATPGRFCSTCGREFEIDDNYCSGCGSPRPSAALRDPISMGL